VVARDRGVIDISRLKVAMCQMAVTDDKARNLARAREMIRTAGEEGSDIVVLPEMFNCPYDSQYFAPFAEEWPHGPSLNMLRETAIEGRILLVGGSIPERHQGSIFNTSFVFGPSGELLARHRKVHLFDVDIPGGITFKESDTLSPGNDVTLAPLTGSSGKLGVAVCYDIRFPELFRRMALGGAMLVAVPAAFNLTTGPAHWDLLFRTRAVDNQVFVVGVSPARLPGASYVAFGHSILVDPWGEVLAMAAASEDLVVSEIDLARVEQVRRELPLLKHRRAELY